MKKMYYILVFHIVLLLLASTNFTIIMFLREGTSLSWNYYSCTRRSGFGFEYVSDYSLPQVLAYIAAYAAGLMVFLPLFLRGCKWLGLPGLVLSILGLTSFVIEGSHWTIDHHRSWIVSFPIAFIVLWILLGVNVFRKQKSHKETEHRGPVDAAARPD
jgi:hypothetical protein